MTDDVLWDFFRSILKELAGRLTPAEFKTLMKEEMQEAMSNAKD